MAIERWIYATTEGVLTTKPDIQVRDRCASCGGETQVPFDGDNPEHVLSQAERIKSFLRDTIPYQVYAKLQEIMKP